MKYGVIYSLLVLIEKLTVFQQTFVTVYYILKQFVSKLVFEELQLTQILMNFKTSRCNLNTRGLGAKE